MNIRELPKGFIEALNTSIPTEAFLKMQTCDKFEQTYELVLNSYFGDVIEKETAKTKLYNYYYDIKRKWSDMIQSYLSKEEIDFAAIQSWIDDKNSGAFDFPYILQLSTRTIRKALHQDILHYTVKFIDLYYSGSKDMLFIKSTDLILSGIFGYGINQKDLTEDERIEVRNDIVINENTKHVVLFTTFDAKIINAVYQLGFNQLLKGKKVRVRIKDVTQIIYGNTFTKNKNRIIEQLTYLNQYRTAGQYYNEKGTLVDRYITFIPDISIIHERSPEVELEYSDSLRKAFLNNPIIEENSLLSLPAKSKEDLTYLIHEIIKKIRIELENDSEIILDLSDNSIEYRLTFLKLSQLLDIKDDYDTRQNIESALQGIVDNTTKVSSYKIVNGDYILGINRLTEAESNYFSRLKSDIKQI